MTVELIEASASDLDRVAEIDSIAFEFAWTREQFQSSFEAGHRFILVKENAIIVGFAVYMQIFEQAELLSIAIDPRHRRKGYAKMLIEQMSANLMRGGAEQLFLEVRVSNQPAISLYEKMGFKAISRRKGYYPTKDGHEDAIVMQKNLLR